MPHVTDGGQCERGKGYIPRTFLEDINEEFCGEVSDGGHGERAEWGGVESPRDVDGASITTAFLQGPALRWTL